MGHLGHTVLSRGNGYPFNRWAMPAVKGSSQSSSRWDLSCATFSLDISCVSFCSIHVVSHVRQYYPSRDYSHICFSRGGQSRAQTTSRASKSCCRFRSLLLYPSNFFILFTKYSPVDEYRFINRTGAFSPCGNIRFGSFFFIFFSCVYLNLGTFSVSSLRFCFQCLASFFFYPLSFFPFPK